MGAKTKECPQVPKRQQTGLRTSQKSQVTPHKSTQVFPFFKGQYQNTTRVFEHIQWEQYAICLSLYCPVQQSWCHHVPLCVHLPVEDLPSRHLISQSLLKGMFLPRDHSFLFCIDQNGCQRVNRTEKWTKHQLWGAVVPKVFWNQQRMLRSQKVFCLFVFFLRMILDTGPSADIIFGVSPPTPTPRALMSSVSRLQIPYFHQKKPILNLLTLPTQCHWAF